MIIEESDCCGNGCSNCILDMKPDNIKPPKTLNDKTNCLLNYRQYQLIEKSILDSSEILKLKFKLHCSTEEDKNLTFYLPAGHHIMMKINGVRRPYSPFWINQENLEFEFLVNLKLNGDMSKSIKQLNVKDFVEFIGPIGSFYHKINEYDQLIIFTQGIAIAPTIRIIEEILENDEDDTRIHFLGCFTNLDSLYFREQLSDFRHFWNFNSHIFLSHQNCTECIDINIKDCQHFRNKLKYNEVVRNGRLTKDDIVKLPINLNSRFIICGSKEFEKFIKLCLDSININKNYINVL